MAPVSQVEDQESDLRRFSDEAVEMTASLASSVRDRSLSPSPVPKKGFRTSIGLGGVARRTLGICLLLVTVFLWTSSNFLASVGDDRQL